MENIPITRQIPRLDLLMPPSSTTASAKKVKSRSKPINSKSLRTLSPLNLTIEDDTTENANANIEHADVFTTNRRTTTADLKARREDTGERTLPSPPDSRTGKAGGLFGNGSSSSDVVEESGSSRKRTRATANAAATSHTIESPNPKSRKQLKTRAIPEDASDSDGQQQQREPSPRQSASSKRKPPSTRRTAAPQDEDAEPKVVSTPTRRTTRTAPKTEKIATRVQLSATSTAAPLSRSRRKSAPNGSRRKAQQPDLAAIPEPESDGDDPLLLIGTDTWVPVPWKPMFGGDTGNVEVKTEQDESNDFPAEAFQDAPEDSIPKGPGDEMNGVEHGDDDQPEGAREESSSRSPSLPPPASRSKRQQTSTLSQKVSRPLFPDFLTRAGNDDQTEEEVTATLSGAPRDPDSSFSGMDIDGDAPVREFTVPLRTASPPARRRRRSAVSQREETPGTMLEHVATTNGVHEQGGQRTAQQERAQTMAGDNSVRRTASPALISFTSPPVRATSQTRHTTPSAASSFKSPPIRPSPGPLRIAPVTPTALRRDRTPSLSTRSPFHSLHDSIPAYPSPRYVGKELGSLSPEKGRGPTRGMLPRLDEDDREETANGRLDFGGSDEEDDDMKEEDEQDASGGGDTGGHSQAQLRPRGGWIDADHSNSAGEEEDGDGNGDMDHGEADEDSEDLTHVFRSQARHARRDTDHEDEEEEERQNSIRIERELTVDLSEDEDDRMDEGGDEYQAPAALAFVSSAQQPTTDVEPKEEDDHPPTTWHFVVSEQPVQRGPAFTLSEVEGATGTKDAQPDEDRHPSPILSESALQEDEPPSRRQTTGVTTLVEQDAHYESRYDQREAAVEHQAQYHHIVAFNDPVFDKGDEEESESESDDDGPPVIEITSKDPMVAARAAAILKLHHDYIEEEARRKRRRRSSAASLSFDPRSSSVVAATPPVSSRMFGTPDNGTPSIRQFSVGATPVPPEILRLAEEEVASPVVTRACASASVDPSTPGPSRFPSLNAKYTTPIQRAPSIPEIIIDPASSRPSERDARASSETEGEEEEPKPMVWTKADWKGLERCLLDEREAVAEERGVESLEVDVATLDMDRVLDQFLKKADVDVEGEAGDWAMDKIRRRYQALAVRHSQTLAGSAVAAGSSFVVPFSPLPSRHPTPMPTTAPDDTMSTDSSTDPSVSEVRQQSQQPSVPSPPLPLPPSLLAPRYSHLYEEAAVIAGFNAPASASVDRDGAESASTTRRATDSPSPVPSRPKSAAVSVSKSTSASRIPLMQSRLPRPTASRNGTGATAARPGNKKRTQMLPPPPPPVRKRRTPPPPEVVDTPSATSRVLGFLGLGNILRSKAAPVVVPPPPPPVVAGQKRKAVSTRSVSEEIDYNETPRAIRTHQRPTSPIAAVMLNELLSKDDLNHIEPEPPRQPARPPHPRDLVSLSPVPPKETSSPASSTSSRRSSGGSVKDLINNFEGMEDKKDAERRRIGRMVKVGRRVVSGERGGLRRVASNLSTASVISADDLEKSAYDPLTPESRGRAGSSMWSASIASKS